jgi:signal peptidase I
MHIIKKICVLVLATMVLGGSGLVLYRNVKGDRLLSVQTGSMAPYFSPGDAVWTHKTTLSALRVGDIVSYRSPADPRVVVSHRLVSVDYQTGKLVTKGDALDLYDLPFPASQVVGRVYKVLPHVGWGLNWLHQPAGLIIAVYAPAACVFVYEVKRLRKQYSYPVYRHYRYR